MKKPKSLAFRLILYASGWSMAALVVTGLFLSSLFRETVERNFDEYLGVFLKGLVANVEVSDDDKLYIDQDLAEPRFGFPLSGWYWQVMHTKLPLQPVLASPSLLEHRLNLPPWTAADRKKGHRSFNIRGPDNENLHVVEREIILPGSEDKYVFTVAGDTASSEMERSRFNGTLFAALFILGLSLVTAVFLQVRLGLRPLRQIQKSLSAIRSGKEERLKGEFPAEIMPLAREMNALLAHNQEIVERARTHVGNLAHALKTPLSVLTNEADSGSGAFARLVKQQTLNMREQVDLYLDRARVAARASIIGSSTDIGPVLESLVRVLSRINEEKAIEVELDCPAELKFRGEKQDLEEISGNLLDNAFKWARRNIIISATLIEDDDYGPMVRICFEDDGPGLLDHQLAEAMQRGERLDESKPGSGLGLSIVSDVTSLYKGRFYLEKSSLGGLKAVLELPLADKS